MDNGDERNICGQGLDSVMSFCLALNVMLSPVK